MVAGRAPHPFAALVDAAGAMVREAPVGMALVGSDLRFDAVNEALAAANGLAVADLVGAEALGHVPVLADEHLELVGRVLRTGRALTGVVVEGAGPGRPDDARQWLVDWFPVHDGDAVVGVGAVVVDVTDREQLREQLLASEQRYRSLFESGVIGVLVGEDDRITDANDRFLEIVGLDRAALADLRWPELTPPEWSDTDRDVTDSLLATGMSPAIEKEYWHADGHRVPVLIGGVLTHRTRFEWMFFAADLSERRELEQARARAQEQAYEHRLRQALEGVLDAIVMVDVERGGPHGLDFVVTYANEGALRLGVHPPQVGRRWSELWPHRVDGELWSALVVAVEERRTVALTAMHFDDIPGYDGERWYDIQFVPLVAGDEVVGEMLAYRDATERELGAAAIRDAQAQLQQAQRIAGLGTWSWDVASGAAVWSAELAEMYGVADSDGGSTVFDILDRIDAADREVFLDTFRRLTRGQRTFRLVQRINPGGRDERLTIVHGEAVVDDDGRITTIRGTTQDVTEQRRTELALRESRDDLAAERHLVDLLQRTIVPDRPVSPPGLEVAAAYHPAGDRAQVGGDWYDALVLPDGRIVLAVGDVAGHGLEASTLMVRTRSALRAYAVDDPDPASVLRRLDRLVTVDEPGAFVTAIVALVDPDSGEVTLARAGHPPPVLVRDGRAALVDLPGGTPLGVGLGDGYPTGRARLDPGDLLLLYTDGLVERREVDLDVGLSRLLVALSGPQPPVAQLVETVVLDARADGVVDDDVCLLGCARV